jgi:hypothetical protein
MPVSKLVGPFHLWQRQSMMQWSHLPKPHLWPCKLVLSPRLYLWLATLLLSGVFFFALAQENSVHARQGPSRRDRRPDREHHIRYPSTKTQ